MVAMIVAERAAPQAGCVSRQELLASGVTEGEIGSLIRRRALRRILPRTYGYGLPVLTQEALWWAAVLHAGEGARLARRSALEAHGLLTPHPGDAAALVPRRQGAGQRTRQTNLETADGNPATVLVIPSERQRLDAQLVGGLWVDAPLQAIDDLAAAGEVSDLRRAWREADFRGLLSDAEVRAHLRTAPPGAAEIRKLHAAIPLVGEGATLLSRAERRLLEALTSAGLEPTHVNELIEFDRRTIRPDFWWWLAQLIVEVDGPSHRLPSRRAEDDERDAHVARVGVEVLRFTDEDVWRDTTGCVQVILATLATRLAVPEHAVRDRLAALRAKA